MNGARRRMPGVGLVEWLVSLALGTLVAVAALHVYARAAADARTSGAVQHLHESARYAADLLERELRVAGYAGLAPELATVDGATPAGTPPPPALAVAGCTPAAALDLAHAVTAADALYALDAATPLGCAPSPFARAQSQSDTLTVRRTRLEPSAAERGRLQVASTRARAVLLADGAVPAALAMGQVHDLEAATYYVSQDSSTARGVPSLRRKRLVGGATGPRFEDEELAVGVEDLQVELGVDGADVDETPERYVAPGQQAAGDTPRTVRFWLRVRTEQRDGTWQATPAWNYAGRAYAAPRDAHRRVLVERTVYLRNLRRH